MNEICIFKETTDDWHSSYKLTTDEKLVKIALIFYDYDEEYEAKICVEGNDDMGFEKEFNSGEDAWECFLDLINLEYVNIQDIENFDFVSMK